FYIIISFVYIVVFTVNHSFSRFTVSLLIILGFILIIHCYILYFSIENLPTTLIILNMASNNDYCCVPQCNSWAKKLPQIACAWSGRKSIVSDKYNIRLILYLKCLVSQQQFLDVMYS
ncbi:unnamed protein product, partial [Callosobruchus maculatus]